MKDATRYTITVTAQVKRTEVVGKDWCVIGQDIKDGQAVDVRGYTPEVEKTVTGKVQIYEQTVDALDMAALVAVVNGLPKGAA